MGLDLVQTEIANVLGFSSVAALKKKMSEKETDKMSSFRSKRGNESISSRNAIDWFVLTNDRMENAESAVAVLTDLLNYDKVSAGNLSLELEPLAIFSLITRTVEEFRLSAESKQLQFETHLVSEHSQEQFSSLEELPLSMRNLYVVGDSVRLAQVLRNLLSNAIKFSNESTVIDVKVVWEDTTGDNEKIVNEFKLKNDECLQLSPKGRIVVHVQDSGAGMSPEQLSRLFTAGTQFNANDLQAGKGSGLGLYIAKGIVEQHGGTVVAESDGIGRGTTFIMTLPAHCALSDGDEEDAVPPLDLFRKEEETCVSKDPSRPRSVLIVDDVSSNRRLLSRLLENNGDTCQQAVDGEDCLKKASAASEEDHRFDIILLDYEMPNMNGPTCAKKLRAWGCSSLIVGLTGNCLAEDVQHFKESGADDVLPKPFKLNALQDIWEKH